MKVASDRDHVIVTGAVSLLVWTVGVCVLAIVLACAGCSRPRTRPTTKPDYQVMSEQLASSVRITTVCFQGSLDGAVNYHVWYGSGVVVGRYDVLTAGHVARCFGASVIQVTSPSGAKRFARVESADYEKDLARLRVTDAPYYDAVAFEYARPRVDERLCATSSAPEVEQSCGRVVEVGPRYVYDAVSHVGVTVDVAMAGAAIEAGNSGSPLWDDAGRLVAVVTHGDTTWCGFAKILGEPRLCDSRASSLYGSKVLP